MQVNTNSVSEIEYRNKDGSVVSHPRVVVRPRSVDDIIEIMKDSEKYPSPVRAVGSNHSTTRCGVADDGTVVDMSGMNRIIEIGADTVTTEAGAMYIDVAKALQKHNLQFHVNIELGNLTMGSACCCATKDASMPGEFGQVCSYAVGIKLVTPAGELIEVTEDDAELLQVMRSSYGLLGIVYEVTFKVKPLRHMAVSHVTYSLDDFEKQLPSLKSRGESMMFYIYPFLNAITVEYRKYNDNEGAPNRRAWQLRNWVWKTLAPKLGYLATNHVPVRPLRYSLINGLNRVTQVALKAVISSPNTIPTDQIIRYPEESGKSKYTFSIWAFPEEKYPMALRAYFAFCREYYRTEGYRCDLLNVGYRISRDQSSLFSYSFDGNVMTVDPVSTGGEMWDEFLKAYNEFCSENGGTPLFNQTKWISPEQVEKAFGNRLQRFADVRKQYDPNGRLLNAYFAEILG